MRARGVGWAALWALCTISARSHAGGSATELVAARELWEQAQAAQDRRDWPECERALVAALPIVSTPGLRFHLAHCREMQGKWVEALVDYKLVDELITSGTPAPDVEPLLRSAITRLETKTPKLTLEVVEPPEDLQFMLDGKSVSRGLLNTRLSLNPGSHQIELHAPGYVPLSRRVVLVESETRTLPLTLVRDAAAPEAPVGSGETRPGEADASLQPYLLISEAAFTLGAGSMALYYGLETSSATPGDARDSAKTKAMIWGVGSGVGLMSFFATWLLWPDNVIAVKAGSSGAQLLLSGRY